MLKSHRFRGFLICFGVTFVSLFLYFSNVFDALELKTIDLRFQQRGPREINKDIVIVTIDEDSIQKLGRWPWPREVHGILAKKLTDAGAKVVGFDVLFTEADDKDPASDSYLAQVAGEAGNVVSAFFFRNDIKGSTLFGENPLHPYPELDENSLKGFVNLIPDADGVTRQAPLYLFEKLNDQGEMVRHPSLAVRTLSIATGKSVDDILPPLPSVLNENELAFLNNRLMINYADPRYEDSTYTHYSIVDVLNENIDLKEAFQDKIVLVGGTATALFDIKAIPFVEIYPGVEIHANVIDNLITGNPIQPSGIEIPIFYILILGALMGFIMPRVGTWAKMGAFLMVVLGGLFAAQWIFTNYNKVVPIIAPLFTAVACYGGIIFYQLVIEEREKRKIKGSFKQYLSPKIIEIITKDPSKLQLGGEEREVSIFFLDIKGFTAMSEALKPTQLVGVMNQCLTTFSDVILKHDGLINKYIGDCIMAFWNSPIDQPNHASLASYAALDCINAIPALNESFEKQGLPSIDCRIGINSGTVVVGNMGSNERFDYTVMGDPVNLASRLEGANKQYKTRIMISEDTFEKAKADIEARELDLIRVVGKKEPKRVYEVLARKGELRNEMEKARNIYLRGLEAYRKRDFEEAIHTFQEVFDYAPNDPLALKYLERSRTFQVTPPPSNWDGVFEMKTK